MQYQKEDVRQRILQAALSEFWAKGYAGGKISNIARSAGVPVGNLYRYFDGKNGLLDALVKETYIIVPGRVAEAVLKNEGRTKPPKPPEELADSVAAFVYGVLAGREKEFLILTDKCGGSKYEDFKLKLYALADKYINDILVKAKNKEDEAFCSVISKAFLDMIIDILRKGDDDLCGRLMKKLLIFFFYDAQKRV